MNSNFNNKKIFSETKQRRWHFKPVPNGFGLLNSIFTLAILGLIIPSIITITITCTQFLYQAFQQQVMIHEHLFIDHLLRHDIAKSDKIELKNGLLTLSPTSEEKIITYTHHNHHLKRRQGSTKILTKYPLNTSIRWTSIKNQITIPAPITPIIISLKK